MFDSAYEIFAADQRTQWAVEMGLIRIGEGINRIPVDVLGRFSEQPWRQMVAMRDFAAHQYEDLDRVVSGPHSRGTTPPFAPISSTS